MNLKKKIAAAILGGLLFNPASFPLASAEIQTIEAEGFYTMGDGPEENPAIAKERARADAKRAASEQASVFVESISEVKNGNLTRDEIRTVSATVLQVVEAPISVEVINENIIQYRCHIIVTVDTENVQAQLYKGRDKIEEATHRVKELEADKARLNSELAELKAKYKVATEIERQEISKDFKRNEEKFSALQLTEQGENFYNNREYPAAIDALNKATEIDPNYANAWAWLGAVYNDFGNSQKAMEYNQKAIELNDKNALAWNNLGVTYAHLGYFEKSIECYKKSISLDEKLLYPLCNLSGMYIRSGDLDKALEFCNKAIEIAPNRAYAWSSLGNVYSAMYNYEKSFELYTKAIELDPNNAIILSGMGNLFLQLGHKEKATEYFNKAIELNQKILEKSPDDIMELILLSYTYRALEDYDKAIECSRRAVEINTNAILAWNILGESYFFKEDYVNAAASFKKVLELDNQNVDA